MITLGIGLAIACALMSNVALLCKYRGATQAPDVRFRRPLESAKSLFASRWWTIGFAIAFVAWGLHVAALALAPLSLVQSVIAGGIALLAVPARHWFGIKLGWREMLGLGLSASGLAFLALTATDHSSDSSYSVSAMATFEGGAIVLGLALLLSRQPRQGAPPRRSAAGRGGRRDARGLRRRAEGARRRRPHRLPGDREPLDRGRRGRRPSSRSTPSHARSRSATRSASSSSRSVAANAAAIVGGVLVFGDPMGSDTLAIAARSAAFAAVIAAAALIPAAPQHSVQRPQPRRSRLGKGRPRAPPRGRSLNVMSKDRGGNTTRTGQAPCRRREPQGRPARARNRRAPDAHGRERRRGRDELAELKELLRTAGVATAGDLVQHRDEPDPDRYLGRGKIDELKREIAASGANLVACDDELAPRQERNLEAELDVPVVDRTAVILDIFADHAHTAEGKLQVELAQLEYNLARLRGLWTHLDALAGGFGSGGGGRVATRGPGEAQIEVDRRLARDRIAALRRRLERTERNRAVMRSRRDTAVPPDDRARRLHERGEEHPAERPDRARTSASASGCSTPSTRPLARSCTTGAASC